MHVAVVPVERDEGLVDLLEQRPLAYVAVVLPTRAHGRCQGAGANAAVVSGQQTVLDDAHREPVARGQLHLVHEPGDEVEAAAGGREQVGEAVGVEAVDVEAGAVVPHLGDEVAALELQVDLEVVAGAAVAQRVRHGLFDGQHDGVDRLAVADVAVQVVADTLPGTQQARRVEWQGERKARG